MLIVEDVFFIVQALEEIYHIHVGILSVVNDSHINFGSRKASVDEGVHIERRARDIIHWREVISKVGETLNIGEGNENGVQNVVIIDIHLVISDRGILFVGIKVIIIKCLIILLNVSVFIYLILLIKLMKND